MLRHTEADIPTVGKYDLVVGKTYIIQHSKEGLKSINTRLKLNPEEINKYYTRFRGKFVKYDIGRSEKYPDGIQDISPSREVAVFENVEIISKNKTRLTDDIYVLFRDPREGRQHIVKGFNWVTFSTRILDRNINIPQEDQYSTAVRQLLLGIKRHYNVAFAVNTWTFAESAKELEDDMKSNIFSHMANDKPSGVMSQVIVEPLMSSTIGDFAGTQIQNNSTQFGNKRKRGEGGGRRKTRRSRRNKRSKTRKGKSKKS